MGHWLKEEALSSLPSVMVLLLSCQRLCRHQTRRTQKCY
jgi:hypothetical protein